MTSSPTSPPVDEEEPEEPTWLERRYAGDGVPDDVALWAPRVMGTAAVGSVAALVSAFLPWAHARLTDRGEDLLVVTAKGTDYHFTGRWVVVLAILGAAGAAYVVVRPMSRLFAAAVSVLGVAVVAAAMIGEGNNTPTVHKLRNLRIGTVEVDNPVAHTTIGYGLWIAMIAGLVMTGAALVWVAFLSSSKHRR
ncbi:MAG: Trp biosynthesis-associated membrane protein [Frankia sp.]